MCACKKVRRDLQAMIDQLDAIGTLYKSVAKGSKPLAGLLEMILELRRWLVIVIENLNTS